MATVSQSLVNVMATTPAIYTEDERCEKIQRLLTGITPEHFSKIRESELPAIIQRLRDMSFSEHAPGYFFDNERGSRFGGMTSNPDIFLDSEKWPASDVVEFITAGEFTPLFDPENHDVHWATVINIGFPIVNSQISLRKFGFSIPIYKTTDGLTAVAEMIFLPCKTAEQSQLIIQDKTLLSEPHSVFDDEGALAGNINLSEKYVRPVMQHLDGDWFSVEPFASDTWKTFRGRKHEKRACFFSTGGLPENSWRISDIKL